MYIGRATLENVTFEETPDVEFRVVSEDYGVLAIKECGFYMVDIRAGRVGKEWYVWKYYHEDADAFREHISHWIGEQNIIEKAVAAVREIEMLWGDAG